MVKSEGLDDTTGRLVALDTTAKAIVTAEPMVVRRVNHTPFRSLPDWDVDCPRNG